jgi:hypothetical protein
VTFCSVAVVRGELAGDLLALKPRAGLFERGAPTAREAHRLMNLIERHRAGESLAEQLRCLR